MAARIELVPLTAANIDLADMVTYRIEDENECMLSGRRAAEAVRSGAVLASSYALYCEGDLLGFAGHGPTDGFFGPTGLWLLTTPAVERHKISFVRFVRESIDYLLQQQALLCVQVDPRYGRAMRLASSLGMRFTPVEGGFVVGVLS